MTAELQPSSPPPPPTVVELPADATAMLMTAVSCLRKPVWLLLVMIMSDSSKPAEVFVLAVAADPHIKVCGRRENVREAKDRIMSVLDTKVNNIITLFFVFFFLFCLTPSCF